MSKYTWLDMPDNIKGINYDLIRELNDKYKEIENFIDNYEMIIDEYKKFIQDFMFHKINNNDNMIDDNFTHIIPPYTTPCSYNSENACSKKAAFLDKKNKKYYCWFHMYNHS